MVPMSPALVRPLFPRRQPEESELRLPDINDILQQQLSMGLSGGGSRPPLPVTEEETQGLAGMAMGGVEAIGNVLDTPGSFVRGILSGEPGRAFEGVLDPEKRVSGEEMLQSWGMLGDREETDWSNWGSIASNGLRTVAGIGAEIATDPLTLVSGPMGALTKAGKAAKEGASAAAMASKSVPELASAFKAGKLGDVAINTPLEIADQIRKGERGLLSVSLTPFSKEPLFTLGAGSETAAKALESAYYGKISPLRYARGLFSSKAAPNKVTFDASEQMLNDLNAVERAKLTAGIQNFHSAMMDRAPKLEEEFAKIAEHHGAAGDKTAYEKFMRSAVITKDGLPQPADIQAALEKHLAAGTTGNVVLDQAKTKAMSEEMYQWLDALKGAEDAARERINALGGDIPGMFDLYTDHGVGRRAPSVIKAKKEQLAKRWQSSAAQDAFRMEKSRQDPFRHVPGGEVTINDLIKNDVLMGTGMEKAEHVAALKAALKLPAAADMDLKTLRETYLRQIIEPKLNEFWNGREPIVVKAKRRGQKDVTHTLETELDRWFKPGQGFYDDAGKLIKKPKPTATTTLLRKLDSMPLEARETGLFSQSILDDAFDYLGSAAATESTLTSAHNFLAQPGVVGLESKGFQGVPLREAFQNAGLRDSGIETFLKTNFADQATSPEAIKRLMADARVAPGAEHALAAYSKLTSRQTQGEIGKALDKLNSLYKSWLYNPFPASHLRNVVSDFWNSWSHGKVDTKPLLRAYADAMEFMKTRGGEAAGDLAEFTKLNGMEGSRIVDTVGEAGAGVATRIPEGGAIWALKGLKPSKKLFNPLAVPGLSKPGEAMNPLMEFGNRAQNVTEFLGKGAYYTALKRQGYSPAQAMHLVKQALFDYGDLSSFDKSVMKRIAPFWAFTRKNTPYQLLKIAENPGGRTSQTIRAINDLSRSDEDVYTPGFLQEGMAVPLGNNPTEQAFFRNTLIPVDSLNKLVTTGGTPNPLATGQRFASLLHPLLAAPVELASGKQLSTGRNIADLESTTSALTGGAYENQQLDRVLHYMPFSRFVGEGLRLTDPRKTWGQIAANSLGMGKVSTYDTEKWKAVDLRNAIQEQLAANPNVREFDSYYVPQSKKEKMDPAELALVQAQNRRTQQLSELLKDMAARRKAQRSHVAQQ
jgi:hypothetical protein